METEDENWDLNEPELSWDAWCLLEQTDWRHLPFAGGILDQPESLWKDLLTINYQRACVEEMMKT